MNSFWGCDTTDIDHWAEVGSEHAAALTTVLDDLAATGAALQWFGPDATDFQEKLDSHLRAGYEAGRRIVRFLERIRAEGQEQDDASSGEDAGTGSGGSGAGGAGRSDGGATSGTPATGSPQSERPLFGPSLSNPFGPMIHPDPVGLVERLREKVKDIDYQAPWWDPGLHRPIGAPRFPLPIPELQPTGNTAPDISITEDGGAVRALGARQVPGLKQVQMAMSAHDAIGTGLDRLEQGMVDAGHGAYTGALAPVRAAHATAGMLVGEDSVAGQVMGGIDAQIANTMHTTGTVGEALLDGDLMGAAREAEMGLARNAEASIDILTASPVRAVAGFTSDTLEKGADVLEPIAPPAVSEKMRGTAESIDGQVAAWDEATSAQRFLDWRYQYVPMPWDQAS